MGYSIELWRRVAQEAGLDFEFTQVATVPELIERLKQKQADAGVGAIRFTSCCWPGELSECPRRRIFSTQPTNFEPVGIGVINDFEQPTRNITWETQPHPLDASTRV